MKRTIIRPTLSIHSVPMEAAYEVTEQLHQGKTHLVIPVTLMVEGVHNGSAGPLFHSIDELGKYPASWDGIPVIIDHPQVEGVYVSANYPDIVDTQVIGRVYNSYVDGDKLRGEVWIDEEKLRQVSSSTLAEIKAGTMLEVSVGVFTDEDKTPGTWNEEPYEATAINHRPDHLALLPGGTGACSVEDGCGLRANQETPINSGNIEVVENSDKVEREEEFLQANATMQRTRINNNLNKEDKKMSAKNGCIACLDKMNALIANKESGFVESDREWLEVLSEDALDKVAPKVIEREKIVEKTVEVNKLSDEDKAILAYGKKQMKERKDKMISEIKANTKEGVWNDETLNAMSEDTLERVFLSVNKEEKHDFSLNANSNLQSTPKGIAPMVYIEEEPKK